MKTIFKKSAISLAILTLAGTSYANTTFNGFFGGAEGLYLQPRNGDLGYVDLFPTEPGKSFTTRSIHPEYDWGMRLYGGMMFCGNEDITLSWEHFNTADTSSRVYPENIETLSPLPPGPADPRFLFPNEWSNIQGHVTFRLDDYFAVFGHTINLNAWNLRLAGGVEYARLDSDLTVKAILSGQRTFPDFGYTAKSELRGVGPRVEADFGYNMPYGFSVFAKGNAALLISHRIISLNTLDTFLGNLPSFDFTRRFPLIPKVGLRLGLGFAHTFGQVGGEGALGAATLGIDAGWQVESYIHAIERPVAAVIGAGTAERIFPVVFNTKTKVSNYGNQGPFVGAYLSTSWL